MIVGERGLDVDNVLTDVAGSTALRSSLGENAADELRRLHDDALAEAVAAAGGRVVKGSGDGVLAAFDAASDAVVAAVEMQRAVETLARRRRVELAIRVGISSGDVSWEGGDCFGLPVVEAARLEAAARPGQILCSDVVRVLGRGRSGAEFRPVGELTLRGLAEPVVAWEVAWEPAAEMGTGGPEPFVGRDVELDTVLDRWRQATVGSGGLVVVAGEAGAGKARLLAEVVDTAAAAGATVWSGTCFEGDTTAFGPFGMALDRWVRSADPSETAGVLGPQAPLLGRLASAVADVVGHLATPPPVPAEQERDRLFDAVQLVTPRVAIQGPLLVALDDCHWADPASTAERSLSWATARAPARPAPMGSGGAAPSDKARAGRVPGPEGGHHGVGVDAYRLPAG